MAIWRKPGLGGRGGKPPAPTCGQMAGSSTKLGRALSLLVGTVLLGSIAQFIDMRADAQTSLLDDNAPPARTAVLSPPLNPSSARNEVADDTAGPRIGVRGAELAIGAEGQQRDTASQQDVDQAAPTPANPLWRLPLNQFSATLERPIFSPSRRPPPPAVTYSAPVAVKQPPKPHEPERPTIALTGTIIGTDGYRGAVFRDTSSQEVLRLRVGENYHGWVLLLITSREARLVKDGERALLELPKPDGTPARARSTQEIALDHIWAVGAE
ncbi:hypothetical protein SAMN05444170_1786 [Bradyrhizobium erythrophlei]|jgi:hypothetical protein|uniref:General secretion pathway protein N n=1 Tax=Bradyrhizobium erythrophlei TaxID=1437360 RepID=A0A1M7TIN4_9BRAD|nr:hypothetical protein SAMN05444170_1786 [Bradyrhizobium erythrophlei]